jgi:hypothetical protein
MTALSNRYDFVFLFDVSNGNPNGDPTGSDESNMSARSRPPISTARSSFEIMREERAVARANHERALESPTLRAERKAMKWFQHAQKGTPCCSEALRSATVRARAKLFSTSRMAYK